jgi:hypothetical protein
MHALTDDVARDVLLFAEIQRGGAVRRARE